ncbi:MAG: zinc ABC transporter substrate-binding protein [Bacteroidaceae bacterium]|nr:zinc ABC transporter substrate-binding protein [Bacteroidaceae bacterium]
MKALFRILYSMCEATGALWLGVLLLTSCTSSQEAAQSRCLSATVEPLCTMVEWIAGDEWTVSTVVPAGFSPEQYNPSPVQMKELTGARALFKIGKLGIETTWIPAVQSELPELQVIDTSAGVPNADYDPHTWTSPRNVKQILRNISAAMTAMDSLHADDYARRLVEAEATVDSLDNALRLQLNDLPSRTFVVFHPALTHFAHDYGLRQLAIEKDGKEPTPASLQELVNEAKADSAVVVMVQREFADNSARQIAQQIGAKVVIINPLSPDWTAEMSRIAEALKGSVVTK